jgi:hypothetical protein
MPSTCRQLIASPARISPQTLGLVVLPAQTPSLAVKFGAAFIERRMRQHRAWREQEAEFLARQIVREVEAGILAKLDQAREAAEGLKAAGQ